MMLCYGEDRNDMIMISLMLVRMEMCNGDGNDVVVMLAIMWVMITVVQKRIELNTN